MSTIWSLAMSPLPSVNGIVKTSGQRAGRERRREGRRRPVVLLGLDGDPRVLGLELVDLLVQRVDRLLGHARAQRADDDRDGLLVARPGCGARAGRLGAAVAAVDGAVLAAGAAAGGKDGGGDDGERRQDRRRASDDGPHRVLSSPDPFTRWVARLAPSAAIRLGPGGGTARRSAIVGGHPPRWLRRLVTVRAQPDRRVGRKVAVRDVRARQQDRPMGRQRQRGAGQVRDVDEVVAPREGEDVRRRRDPRRAGRPRGRLGASDAQRRRYRRSMDAWVGFLPLDGQRRPSGRAG